MDDDKLMKLMLAGELSAMLGIPFFGVYAAIWTAETGVTLVMAIAFGFVFLNLGLSVNNLYRMHKKLQELER